MAIGLDFIYLKMDSIIMHKSRLKIQIFFKIQTLFKGFYITAQI